MSDLGTTSLISAGNEAQVRLWFAAAGLGFVFTIISIIVAPSYDVVFVRILSACATALFALAALWPLARRKLEGGRISARLAASLSHLATSGGAWFALVLAIGGVSAGLAVYNRTAAPEPPMLVGLRYTGTRIPSTNSKYPYGLQVVIQTDKEMKGMVAVICDGAVGEGNFQLIGVGAYTGGSGISKERPGAFVVNIQSPSFLPETPIVVRLYSETAIKVLKLESL